MAVIYHEHDSPGTHANDAGFFALVMKARGHLARRARMCVLPNGNRLARFEREAGPLRASACVWNCPGLYEIPAASRGGNGDSIWLLYLGTMVPERLSPVVIDALALLPDQVKLRAVGYETVGAPGYVASLRERAESLGIGHRVEFLPPVSRADLLPITLRSDIGLALIPMTVSDYNFEAMTGASNKVFDYMACGLPVLVSALPDWCEMFVRPGYGLACNPADARSIAAAVRQLVEDRAKMRAMGEAGRRQILEHWNYETMFAPVARRGCRGRGGMMVADQVEILASSIRERLRADVLDLRPAWLTAHHSSSKHAALSPRSHSARSNSASPMTAPPMDVTAN